MPNIGTAIRSFRMDSLQRKLASRDLQKNGCDFCDEIHWKPFSFADLGMLSRHGSRVHQLDDRLGVVCIPDRSPLADAHLLICTRMHLSNFGHAGAASLRESASLIIQLALRSITGPNCVLFFEHGSRSCTHPKGCVDHAHIHVVPLPIFDGKRLFSILEAEYGHSVLSSSDQLCTVFSGRRQIRNKDYLLVGIVGSDSIVKLYDADFIPSQYIRYVVAEMLNVDPHKKQLVDLQRAFMRTEAWISSLRREFL